MREREKLMATDGQQMATHMAPLTQNPFDQATGFVKTPLIKQTWQDFQ